MAETDKERRVFLIDMAMKEKSLKRGEIKKFAEIKEKQESPKLLFFLFPQLSTPSTKETEHHYITEKGLLSTICIEREEKQNY